MATCVREGSRLGACNVLGELIGETAIRYNYRNRAGTAFVSKNSLSIHFGPCKLCADYHQRRGCRALHRRFSWLLGLPTKSSDLRRATGLGKGKQLPAQGRGHPTFQADHANLPARMRSAICLISFSL
jgi:hypothetical protein